MSEMRGDCAHGHATEVLEMARLIGSDHDIRPVETAALIIVPEPESKEAAPVMIGVFNTTGLMQIAGAALKTCAEHKPDGCPVCDAAAKAAKDASLILRARFRHYMDGGR
jgi:hypothetical protein